MTVGKEVARSAGWTVAMRLADRSIGFVSMLALARLLVPADFGLVAMATSVVALLDSLTAFGFESAVIQRQTAENRLLNTAWTLNVLIGCTNGAVLIALIPLATAFFHEPRLGPLVMVLALSSAISGFRNVGMVVFEQQLQFRRIFALTLMKKLSGFAVTLTIALMYQSYWALVLGSLAAAVMDVVLTFVLSSYRPRFGISSWREIIAFSRWMYSANVMGFVNSRGTHFITGRLAGANVLGTLNMSYELGALPTSELVLPVFRALFPGCARLKDRPAELRAMIRSVIALMLLGVAPAAAGIVALAEPIVLILLGPKWTEAIPLVRVFGMVGAIAAFGAPINALALGVGRPDIPARLSLLNALLGLPLFAVLLHFYGAVAGAIGLLGAGVVVTVVAYRLSAGLIGPLYRGLWRDLWRPALAAIVMGLAVSATSGVAWTQQGTWLVHFLVLLLLIALGAAVYATMLTLLWVASGKPAGPERQAIDAIQEWLASRRASTIDAANS